MKTHTRPNVCGPKIYTFYSRCKNRPLQWWMASHELRLGRYIGHQHRQHHPFSSKGRPCVSSPTSHPSPHLFSPTFIQFYISFDPKLSWTCFDPNIHYDTLKFNRFLVSPIYSLALPRSINSHYRNRVPKWLARSKSHPRRPAHVPYILYTLKTSHVPQLEHHEQIEPDRNGSGSTKAQTGSKGQSTK